MLLVQLLVKDNKIAVLFVFQYLLYPDTLKKLEKKGKTDYEWELSTDDETD